MKIDESNIRRCATVLVGFSEEQKFTIDDIALPVYAGGINLNVNFAVLDSPSAYNMILGRPWDPQDEGSTLHLPPGRQVPHQVGDQRDQR